MRVYAMMSVLVCVCCGSVGVDVGGSVVVYVCVAVCVGVDAGVGVACV